MAVHNCQDFNFEFLPIIYETMSASDWKIKRHTGTPKGLDGGLERLWQASSQAEFAIKCMHGGCNYWNIPALSHDLLDMIGPAHSDISEDCPGIVCAKCRKPLDPRRHGRWIHALQARRWSHCGYHIPQIIMPMHYADPVAWDLLVGKQHGRGMVPLNVFFNEVCGESYDTGSKLVTITDLKAACVLNWNNRVDEAEQHANDGYIQRVLSVDWGGGGGRLRSSSASKKADSQRLRTSYTVLTVLGLRPDGRVDVLWGMRSLRTHDHVHEAKLVLAAMKKFRCSHLIHDYNGAGAVRETLVRQGGLPMKNIIAAAYHGGARGAYVRFNEATEHHPRNWWSIDKSRSLLHTCEAIKAGHIRFFKYDFEDEDNSGLVNDFLALIEEKLSSRLASDVHIITKNVNMSDDFAQAVNIGATMLWYMNKAWPNLAIDSRVGIPDGLWSELHPDQPDWDGF